MSTANGLHTAGAPQYIDRHLALKDGIGVVTLAAALTLSAAYRNVLKLDPGGAGRDVNLPAEATSNGLVFIIYNAADADEDLTVKDDTPATVETIGRGETYLFICDGTTWYGVAFNTAGQDVSINTIDELTAGNGVVIDGLKIKDATIQPIAGGTAFIDLTQVATGEADVVLKDNLADALSIREGANNYLKIITTDSSEAIEFGKVIQWPAGLAAVLDVSACATGEADVIVGDNLASAYAIREGANDYLVVDTTNDKERVSAKKLMTFPQVTTVNMADVAHALVLGTAGANETKLVGNVVFCDPNSAGASENLTLPPEADSDGLVLYIFNTGGEGIVILDDAAGTVATLLVAEHAIVACDGTTWKGLVGAET